MLDTISLVTHVVLPNFNMKGLPCIPEALATFAQPHNQIKPDDVPAPVMIEVGTLISLSVALAVVAFLFLVSMYFNFLRKNTVFSRNNFETHTPSIPSQVIFDQVEMKNTEMEAEDDTTDNGEELRTPLLQKNLEVFLLIYIMFFIKKPLKLINHLFLRKI